MNIWEQTTGKISPVVWITAGFISIVLLALVLMQVNWGLMIKLAQSVSLPLFVLSLSVLVFEGVFTTLRLQLFTPNKPLFKDCLQVVAWFVVLLVILPARLGEVAIIVLIQRYLRQNAGSALISVVIQRIFDLIMLSAVFLLAAIAVSKLSNTIQLVIIASLLLCILIAVLCCLPLIMRYLQVSFSKKQPVSRLRKKLLSGLNNAIVWHDEHITQRILLTALMYTAIKWLCNIGGIVLLFTAINLPLSIADNTLLAAAYNFLGVIPLQTVGGFGVSEAGLAGLLVLFGLSLTTAASFSMMARVVIILNPFIFWLLVMLGLKCSKAAK